MSEEKKNTQQTDYSDDARYDRRGAVIKALLKWLQCEFFGLFIFLSLLALTLVLKKAGYAIFGGLGLLTYAMILVDFGLKEGSKARIKNDVRGDDVKRSFGLALGLIAMMPAALTYIMLLLSYFGVIGSAVLPFKALNFGLWGLISLFARDMDIANMSVHLLWVYPLTMLVYPLAVHYGFKSGFDSEDIRTKIMYKTN
ncbi:MAG: hypothetical protein IIZ73_08890 [Ruminococcus sp.]|nr:hypothetical protein [Ruminococcus sp.]